MLDHDGISPLKTVNMNQVLEKESRSKFQQGAHMRMRQYDTSRSEHEIRKFGTDMGDKKNTYS